MKTCPIIFFYESHQDKSAAALAEQLLPFLKQHQFMSLGVEEPSDRSKQATIKALKAGANELKPLMQLTKLPSTSAVIVPEKLSPEEALAQYKDLIKNMIKSVEVTISLLNHLNHIKYFGIDLPQDERDAITQGQSYLTSLETEYTPRNKHMITTIKSQCDQTGQGIFILVGAGHHIISKDLINVGFQVWEFFVYDSEITPNGRPHPQDLSAVRAYYLRNDCKACNIYKEGFPTVYLIDMDDTTLEAAASLVIQKVAGDSNNFDEL